MMTSSEIRQSFLDFFKSKGHTVVPSSALMPNSPNLLFTNAGMNQFVPIFLGQTKCPYTPGRAADTQKCIRAGGKHNDLEDVGLDTYHHTFFEMLGNWSFGDYFKKEAIEWAWELVVGIWKFAPQRLYATVYSPDKTKNDPSEFDKEAYDFWAEKFRSVGLDPAAHIVNGSKKDNFWMMGDTGPCGPCSEIHVDLTPNGDTKGALVNKGDARCIEIWNLVFIQFNANPDGTFSPLPAKHVDTGMGFERVTGIIQNTKNFTDFSKTISNYETDIFRPLFDKLEQLSGKKYKSTLPPKVGEMVSKEIREKLADVEDHLQKLKQELDSIDSDSIDYTNVPETTRALDIVDSRLTNQEKIDIAFRVIADHIRTLSFAIADGIQPGNTDRNYVLRRILRRAVRYGRKLGFHEPFFYKLVDVLADTMGDVFPEIRAKQQTVKDVLKLEEEGFNKTLDRGIQKFNEIASPFVHVQKIREKMWPLLDEVNSLIDPEHLSINFTAVGVESARPLANDLWKIALSLRDVELSVEARRSAEDVIEAACGIANADEALEAVDDLQWLKEELGAFGRMTNTISGEAAFQLYDTYGFPIDLTEIMAREQGLFVDSDRFEDLMEEQRDRARAAQKKEIIELAEINISQPTVFVGYENLNVRTKIVGIVGIKEKGKLLRSLATVSTPLYAEMGGQVGDTGTIRLRNQTWRIINTVRAGPAFCHILPDDQTSSDELNYVGEEIELNVDRERRNAIQRHHTVTHLLHWALHEVVSQEASQKGSFVGPDKLTFDFNSAPLTPAQVADIEKLVNERILENAPVSWTKVPHADVKSRKDVMQFFGDKYGNTVRVVQIGGHAAKLDGYSMELCGGTHTRATGEIGLFRIVGESAIAAGVRRIEAVAGLAAYAQTKREAELIISVAGKVNSPIGELEKKIESLLAHQKELEKQLKSAQQREAAGGARELLARAETVLGVPAIIANVGSADGDTLQTIADSLKSQFKGVIVLGGVANGAVALVASVSSDFTAKVQAGKIIQTIAPIVGGKGGGKPDNARGGGKDVSKLDEALAKAKSFLGS